ncbi:anti-sigma factor [Flavobacterium sp.]|uniref:anti-sigma factor n=1 Tax=Flavobacterium sp. TaxID=239 RepID=UPI00286E886A|nr:anti-sigma factor [Flavobacterium sp.]
MKNEEDKINQLFDKFQNEWDINELNENHDDAFLEKLNQKKPKQKLWFTVGIAATILLSFGIVFFFNAEEKTNNLEFASSETRETDSVFNAMINQQLLKIKENNSPENKMIIDDAMLQMKTFDADYESIKKELEVNGESKQIIFAMISNLQTRISFLQNVMTNIENNEKIKNTSNEKTI